MYRALNPFKDIKAVIQAMRIIRKKKPDLVHCHSAKGGVIGRFAAFLTGVKVYILLMLSLSCLQSQVKSKKYSLLLEKIARLNSVLIGCAESEKDFAIEKVGYTDEECFCME